MGGDNAKFGERRIADEALVGIDFDVGRMIDGEQAHMIEVHGFFHGLHKAKAEEAVFLANTFGGNFQIFVGVGDVALAGGDPVTDYAGANHVSDEFVSLAIPGKENGARTAASVEFADRNGFHGGEVDFILRNACGP